MSTPTIRIDITGPQGTYKTTIAIALAELLHEAGLEGDQVEFADADLSHAARQVDGDAIEGLYYALRLTPDLHVVIATSNVPPA